MQEHIEEIQGGLEGFAYSSVYYYLNKVCYRRLSKNMATKCRFEGVLEATKCEKTTAVKKKEIKLSCKYEGGFACI